MANALPRPAVDALQIATQLQVNLGPSQIGLPL